jgi:hypothetical protein
LPPTVWAAGGPIATWWTEQLPNNVMDLITRVEEAGLVHLTSQLGQSEWMDGFGFSEQRIVESKASKQRERRGQPLGSVSFESGVKRSVFISVFKSGVA